MSKLLVFHRHHQSVTGPDRGGKRSVGASWVGDIGLPAACVLAGAVQSLKHSLSKKH